MHNHTEWEQVYSKYFTENQLAEMARRADPALAAEGTSAWSALIAEVEAAVERGEDPASPCARQLAARWCELRQSFVRWASGPGSNLGEGEVKSALSRMYAERQNWPAGMKPPFSEAALQFIRAATKETKG
ncbi:MAG: TipAS antibiotic-recognition domain-containing protein [Acidobacteria bacterium]|nr:TipAS antibiotic-recognition domain-containing protein [Acidobacteriota bacterium]